MGLFTRKSPEQRLAEDRQRCREITSIVAGQLATSSRWGRHTNYEEGSEVRTVEGAQVDRASQTNHCKAFYEQVGKGPVEALCASEDCALAEFMRPKHFEEGDSVLVGSSQ